jgi:hypothetical protein
MTASVVDTNGKFFACVIDTRQSHQLTSFPRTTLFCEDTGGKIAANVRGNVGDKFAIVVNYCTLALTLPPE